MAVHDLWYKNAILYCLDVEKYMDANGDGTGDFEGLHRRLEYLAGLGVTCLWLQPFYPSPNRDNGYDISDFYGVHPKHGTPGDFVEFMNHANALGLRVIIDLVVNHTSDAHPWFKSACENPQSQFRDWYVWSDERPADWDKGMVFPGTQKSTWTFSDTAGMWYFHRFYDHQPDLDTHNPTVRHEITKIMGYWLELGISGFRMDAVPFIVAKKGMAIPSERDYGFLHELRQFLQWRCRDAVMLAEANVPPDESLEFFGTEGDRLQLMLNFPVNQRLFYALATGDIGPLIWALQQTSKKPEAAQWVQFLRSHDELDLGRLSPEQRAAVFKEFAPDKSMQLYDRGIRRRLAPMLKNDRRRLELAFSLLFSLPGSPMMQYGDEIGMGDDLTMDERECARTPMQWTNEPRGGFSRGRAAGPAGHQRCDLRLREGERCAAASRSGIPPELDRAQDPDAQGMSRAWMGRVHGAAGRCPRGAGDSVRLPWCVHAHAAQLLEPPAILRRGAQNGQQRPFGRCVRREPQPIRERHARAHAPAVR